MEWIWDLGPWDKAEKARTLVWVIIPFSVLSVLVSVLFLYYVKCSLDKNTLLEGKEQYNKENGTRSGMPSFSCKWLNFLIPKTGCTQSSGWEWSLAMLSSHLYAGYLREKSGSRQHSLFPVPEVVFLLNSNCGQNHTGIKIPYLQHLSRMWQKVNKSKNEIAYHYRYLVF